MEMFKHILVPTDFSETSNRALEGALVLASKFGSKLTLMHAYTIPMDGYDYAQGLLWPIDDLARAAKKELDRLLAKTKTRHANVDAVLVCGEPASKVTAIAKECGADLIVLGSHGRRGVSRLLLGSVAEKVVRLSPVPVLTISSHEQTSAKKHAPASSNKTPN
jgi:nucleotide-binding universal stress UspA family protein